VTRWTTKKNTNGESSVSTNALRRRRRSVSSLLVEVVKVGSVVSHPNADRLELAKVKGWQCIIQKGQFQEGDLALFIPPDAILPDSFIEQHKLEYLRKGGRTRTLKLRGELSEGILVSAPPDSCEGQNLAETLGIIKWEPPEPEYQRLRDAKAKPVRNRPNPNFTKYCDPENFKHYPNLFEIGEQVVVTEKIHGTNARFGWVPRHYDGFWGRVKRSLFGWFLDEWEWCVGSRNVHLLPGRPRFYKDDPYHKIAKRLGLKNRIPKGYTVYGEIFGPKIQDLTYGRTEIDIRFFDAKKGNEYLSYPDFVTFCRACFLQTVPLLYSGPYKPGLVETHTCGQSLLDASTLREGCVIKAAFEDRPHPRLGRKILKTINTDYLLRKSGTEFH